MEKTGRKRGAVDDDVGASNKRSKQPDEVQLLGEIENNGLESQGVSLAGVDTDPYSDYAIANTVGLPQPLEASISLAQPLRLLFSETNLRPDSIH